jgi:hypothetical protein
MEDGWTDGFRFAALHLNGDLAQELSLVPPRPMHSDALKHSPAHQVTLRLDY